MLLIETSPCARLPTLRDADALDLPFEISAGMRLHPCTDCLAQRLDVGRTRAAEIDEEVAMHLGDLRVADPQAAAAGRVDELPGFLARRILERRAAGATLDRLRGFARLGDPIHLGCDRGMVAA